MYGNPFGTCKKCGRRILWIRTSAGKNMPVDETFVNYRLEGGGKDRIVTPEGEVVSCTGGVGAGEADGYGYVPHFATCRVTKGK